MFTNADLFELDARVRSAIVHENFVPRAGRLLELLRRAAARLVSK